MAEALFALPLAFAVQHRQADEDRRELTQLAALAATQMARDRVDATLLPYRPEPEQQLGLYGPTGRRINGGGPERLEPVTRPALDNRVIDARADGHFVIAVPIVDNRRVTGVVRTAEPLAAGASRVHDVWLRLAALATLTLLLAGAAAIGLARRLTRPLDNLGHDAARIGEGDFTLGARLTGLPEIDRVGANLTRAAGRISLLLAREQAFTADASHQLRSPLTGLRLTLESELAHPRDNPAEALTTALADVERLEATIDGLLALARDTAGTRVPVALHDILDQLERHWADSFAAAGRRLYVSAAAGLPAPTVSAVALAHVLDVLVDNTHRHGRGDVRIRVRAHHGAISLSVTDEGPGIADPSVIFERRHPAAGGTGIGLALARRLTEAEGGRLRLTRTTPGSTFEVTLPVDRKPALRSGG